MLLILHHGAILELGDGGLSGHLLQHAGVLDLPLVAVPAHPVDAILWSTSR